MRAINIYVLTLSVICSIPAFAYNYTVKTPDFPESSQLTLHLDMYRAKKVDLKPNKQ